MNLLETLKEFKNISPDPAFTEKSKRAVLATMPRERLSIGRVFAHIIETGIAVALTVFFILVIAGQFSNVPYVSPTRFSVVNPETLSAEAQAVDIQIQLANVTYQEPTTTIAIAQTTPQAPAASAIIPARLGMASAASSSTSAEGEGSSTATSTQTVSIDEALKALSQ